MLGRFAVIGPTFGQPPIGSRASRSRFPVAVNTSDWRQPNVVAGIVMTVLKRKDRMLSFRLSEEQYTVLLRLSQSNGARSISDYARDALFGMLAPGAKLSANQLEHKMEQLAHDVAALSEDVQFLRGLVVAREAGVQE